MVAYARAAVIFVIFIGFLYCFEVETIYHFFPSSSIFKHVDLQLYLTVISLLCLHPLKKKVF